MEDEDKSGLLATMGLSMCIALWATYPVVQCVAASKINAIAVIHARLGQVGAKRLKCVTLTRPSHQNLSA